MSLVGFSAALALQSAQAGITRIQGNQLWVDGQPQPQLYGAELQYFRLRGGSGRNIPRAEVIARWNQALDRMVEAGMNAISFYIPWDFHEYAEGRFDFTGTADEDGDGRPDYPSRDLVTFFKLIEEHGIRHILVRPGPYINAEWGFLGFGAVPLWFHDKYPDSHSRNPRGQRTTLYSYSDPDFLRHSRIWLETLYREVLSTRLGPGRPIDFIQIDNETNFMWQSIYNHDYGPRARGLYRDYLKGRYATLDALDARHGRSWKTWDEVQPPVQAGANVAEDQDWYAFQDRSMADYLREIRKVWTDLGVTEPSVLFTLAESYNATENGVLPNYRWRNSPDIGMMTVNLYPKTYETADRTLMNLPFKADHDVKAADAANDFYLGRREEWALGPEIQAGWWRGIQVSDESRRQTYLTTLGHGLKALFLYYFSEGDNWQHDWMKNAIRPYFDELKATPPYQALPEDGLPDSFWRELDARVADRFLVTDTRSVWQSGGTQPERLYFDAPLGPDAETRAPYGLVRDIGQKLVVPYGKFLGSARAVEDPVCLVKDTDSHLPSPVAGINSRVVQSDWSGGLLGLLMQSGINAHVHHWGLNPKAELLDGSRCRLVIYQDTGLASPELVDALAQVIDQGGAVLSFIHGAVADELRSRRPSETSCTPSPIPPMDVVGYVCHVGIGALYYAKIPIYDVFNTDFYFLIHDARERRGVMDRILSETGIAAQVRISGGGDRTVSFARSNASGSELWVTLKTSRLEGFQGRVQWQSADPARVYRVTDVLAGRDQDLPGSALSQQGFDVGLGASGSAAFYVRPL